MGAKEPTDSRVRCPACHGRGATHGAEIERCGECFEPTLAGPCSMHRCKTCNGKSVVCPRCRGMRFIRVALPVGNDVERCRECCEGNNVNDEREMRAVLAYIARRAGKRREQMQLVKGQEA